MFLGQEVHDYMVFIAYFTELILQICDYAKNDAFDAKMVNMRLTKIFIAIFASDERLPGCHSEERQMKNHREIIRNYGKPCGCLFVLLVDGQPL